MIDFDPILKIFPIFAIALIVPGPDFMMISSMALSRGRIAGLLAAIGIAGSVLVYVSLCMFGFALIFSQMHWLIEVIRVCGGLYLIYLGIQLWRASLKPQQDPVADMKIGKKRNPLLVGFLTNLTNPKAVAFFSSIFALILPADATRATHAAIIAVMAVMPVMWFGIVTFVLSTPAMRKVYLRSSRWIDPAAGTFLAFFGARLLWSGRN